MQRERLRAFIREGPLPLVWKAREIGRRKGGGEEEMKKRRRKKGGGPLLSHKGEETLSQCKGERLRAFIPVEEMEKRRRKKVRRTPPFPRVRRSYPNATGKA